MQKMQGQHYECLIKYNISKMTNGKRKGLRLKDTLFAAEKDDIYVVVINGKYNAIISKKNFDFLLKKNVLRALENTTTEMLVDDIQKAQRTKEEKIKETLEKVKAVNKLVHLGQKSLCKACKESDISPGTYQKYVIAYPEYQIPLVHNTKFTRQLPKQLEELPLLKEQKPVVKSHIEKRLDTLEEKIDRVLLFLRSK